MDKSLITKCHSIKINNSQYNNQYMHHNSRYIAFTINDKIYVYDYVKKHDIKFLCNVISKKNQNIIECVKILFLEENSFVLLNHTSDNVYLYTIDHNESKLETIIRLNNDKFIDEIKFLSAKKLFDDKIIITYIVPNDPYLYLSFINIKDKIVDKKRFNIYDQNKYVHLLTKNHIYTSLFQNNEKLSDLPNDNKKKYQIIDLTKNSNNVQYTGILRYNTKTKKNKKIIIKHNKQDRELFLQYGNNIYLDVETGTERIFYDLKENKIHSIDKKRKEILYLSEKYIADIDMNNNYELTINNKIKKINNKLNLDMANDYARYQETIYYPDHIIIQTKSYNIYMVHLENFKVINTMTDVFAHQKYIKNTNRIFDINVPNAMIYNKKFTDCIFHYPNDYRSGYFEIYKTLSQNNKTKYFKSNFNLIINEKYSIDGRQMTLFMDYYSSDTLLMQQIVSDEISKKFKKLDDYGIIVPIYFSKGQKKDTQTFISGTVLKDENLTHAVQREIYEETGFYVKENIIKQEKTYYRRNKKKHIFTVQIKDDNDLEDKDKFQIMPENDTREKIQVFMWGKYSVLSDIMDEVDYRPLASDNDENKYPNNYIGGIQLIRLSEFIKKD